MEDFVKQNAFSIEADMEDEPQLQGKGKKKKKKAKKQSSDFDLDMDNDDAMMQTRFSHIEKTVKETAQENKGRRGAVRKRPGKLSGHISEVNEENFGSSDDDK